MNRDSGRKEIGRKGDSDGWRTNNGVPAQFVPASSLLSTWSRHNLAERIRQLSMRIGFESPQGRIFESLTYVETKLEEKHVAFTLLLPEQQTLVFTTLYQPILLSKISKENNSNVSVYKLPVIETKTMKEEEQKRVSSRQIRVDNRETNRRKRKKKRWSTFSRIEELLSGGKDFPLLLEPSEESLVFEAGEGIREPPMRGITTLSEDILRNIFLFFSLKERCGTLSRVCKTWYYILKNPIFWKHLEFSGDRVPVHTIVHLVSNSPLLASLRLTAVPDVCVILQELCRGKGEMRELIVRYCLMNKIDCVHTLLQILNSLPNLEVLDLEGTEFQSKRFYTELCLLKNLRRVNLGANRYLHPRDLMTISVNCRRLETLEIIETHSGSERMTDEKFSFIIKNLRESLVHLKYDMQHLGNSAYLAVLQCKKLNTLCLTNCLFLTGEMFRKFNRLEQLKKLTLTRAINLTSEDFENLFGGNSLDIEELDVSGCWRLGETALDALAAGLPHLKKLSLQRCSSVGGEHLVRQVPRFGNLSSLNLAHSGIAGSHLPLLVTGTRLRSLTVDRAAYESSPIVDPDYISPKLKIEVDNT